MAKTPLQFPTLAEIIFSGVIIIVLKEAPLKEQSIFVLLRSNLFVNKKLCLIFSSVKLFILEGKILQIYLLIR